MFSKKNNRALSWWGPLAVPVFTAQLLVQLEKKQKFLKTTSTSQLTFVITFWCLWSILDKYFHKLTYAIFWRLLGHKEKTPQLWNSWNTEILYKLWCQSSHKRLYFAKLCILLISQAFYQNLQIFLRRFTGWPNKNYA